MISKFNTELHDLHCLTYGWADRVKGIKKEAKPVKFTFLGLGCSVTVRYPDYTEKTKKSRIYVFGDEESVLDNLQNRLNRPVALWEMIAVKALEECGFGKEDYSKLKWSQKAGCSMCPCSPGFILQENFWGYDFFVSVEKVNEDFFIADKNVPKRIAIV